MILSKQIKSRQLLKKNRTCTRLSCVFLKSKNLFLKGILKTLKRNKNLKKNSFTTAIKTIISFLNRLSKIDIILKIRKNKNIILKRKLKHLFRLLNLQKNKHNMSNNKIIRLKRILIK